MAAAPRASWARLALLFALFCAVAALDRAPSPAPADAPTTSFSAERALRHVERIARAPHPAGGAANREVREWLIGELRALGLEPEVQPFTHGALALANVVARVRGTEPGGAVLLATHYDSVPTGPGAADAGSCVAALLEAVRAIRAGPALKNDLMLLFSDGEELGLLGASAFVAHHPWVKEARVALNFEARGNSGPVMMFETSDENGWLVRQLAEAVPRPLATSSSVSVYRVLPNDTDFTVLRRAGLQGMNFALLYGMPHYHTFRDTPDALDLRSLQDLGEQALSLARHFGAMDLGQARREPDAVYVSLLRSGLLRYPGSARWPLTLFALCAFVVACVGPGRPRPRLGTMAAGFGVWVGSTVVLVAVLRAAWKLVADLDPHVPSASFRLALVDGIDGACIVLSAVLLAALHAIARRASRRFGSDALAAGMLVPWVALTLGTTQALSGFHYAFCLPLLLGAVAFGLQRAAAPRLLRSAAQLLLLFLVACLLAPMPRHFLAALVIEPAPALVLVALLYGLALPYVLGPEPAAA